MSDKSQDSPRLKLTEMTASKNWPAGRRPVWFNEDARLYTGFSVRVAAHDWEQIVTVFDGRATHAYVTANGFDVAHHGPEINMLKGTRAQHRKAVRDWFRDLCQREVEFT